MAARATRTRRPTARPSATKRPSAATTVPPHDPSAGRLWYLAVPFQQQVEGATWDPARKAHTHTAVVLPAHLLPYRSEPYTVLRRREDDANGTPGAPAPPVAPMTPRELQRDGARVIVDAAATSIDGVPVRGFLLTDDTGVGKTITAFLALTEIAAARRVTRVLILVDRPKQITIPHWRRTITAIGPGDLDILIASPDELPHLLDGAKARWTWDLLVVDEAQLYRNADTARVKRFRTVSRFATPHAKAPFTLWMTATPGNHPAELTYLAPLLAQVHAEPTTRWRDFGGRLLASGLPIRRGPYGAWTWDGPAADDTAVQQAATATVRNWLLDAPAPLTLHRAAPWGPAPLELMPITLGPDERIAYDIAWSAFRRALHALENDREIRGRAATTQGRAAILRFRQKASLLRVPATVAWVLRAVEAGRQVPVSCEFVGGGRGTDRRCRRSRRNTGGPDLRRHRPRWRERAAPFPDGCGEGRRLHPDQQPELAGLGTARPRHRFGGAPRGPDAQRAVLRDRRPADPRPVAPRRPDLPLAPRVRREHRRGADRRPDGRPAAGHRRHRRRGQRRPGRDRGDPRDFLAARVSHHGHRLTRTDRRAHRHTP